MTLRNGPCPESLARALPCTPRADFSTEVSPRLWVWVGPVDSDERRRRASGRSGRALRAGYEATKAVDNPVETSEVPHGADDASRRGARLTGRRLRGPAAPQRLLQVSGSLRAPALECN